MAAPRLHSSDIKTPREAWRVFSAKTAPRMIAVAIVLALAARVVIGDFSWRDVAAAAFMTLVYPFGEWAIHVYLLHLPPFRFRGERVELPTAKAHREHHEQPHRLDWVNFGPLDALAILGLAAPLVIGISALVALALPGPLPLGPFVTMLVTAYLLIAFYEWVHFLIHTSYTPRGRYYRRIWRNHRLHHFKNEHYWHGITNTFSDSVLGTNPEQRGVERSPTARALHG